jgi:hypothetical protein
MTQLLRCVRRYHFTDGMTVRQMAFRRSTSEPRRFRARMYDTSNPAKALIAYWHYRKEMPAPGIPPSRRATRTRAAR